MKIIERTEVKVVDALHKSDPWEETDCGRENCLFGENEKTVGKCKQRGLVYETECVMCNRSDEEDVEEKHREKEKEKTIEIKELEEIEGEKPKLIEINRKQNGEKRKRREKDTNSEVYRRDKPFWI